MSNELNHNAMQRRTFIASAAIMAASAGCLGYQIEPESNIEERKSRIEELEVELEELETKAVDMEEKLNSANSTIDEQQDELASLKSNVETNRRKQVAIMYEIAEKTRWYGAGAWANAIDNWNADDYAAAYSLLGRAYSRYAGSTRVLGRCIETSEEYDLDVTSEIKECKSYSKSMREAAFYYMNSAREATNGNEEKATRFQDTALSHLTTAESYDALNSDVLRNRLGLESANKA